MRIQICCASGYWLTTEQRGDGQKTRYQAKVGWAAAECLNESSNLPIIRGAVTTGQSLRHVVIDRLSSSKLYLCL
jgi:hypothetical protein